MESLKEGSRKPFHCIDEGRARQADTPGDRPDTEAFDGKFMSVADLVGRPLPRPSVPSILACCCDPGTNAFEERLAFKLCEDGEKPGEGSAGGRAGIESFGERPDGDAALPEIIHGQDYIAGAAPQPVEAPYGEHVPVD